MTGPGFMPYAASVVGVALLALDPSFYPLSAHKWRHRVVVVHDAQQGAPWLDAQIAALQRTQSANRERDIVVWVCRDGACRLDPSAGLEPRGMKLEAGAAARYLGIREPSVVLVGKDGRVKLTRTGPVDMDEVHGLIDRMPMRKHEMKGS